jgi:redox-sensitive bicupin YhaK (pirin superfamily)
MSTHGTFRSRAVERIVQGQPTSDGAGVRLTRVLTQPLQRRLDPFLMLDAFGSDSASDYIGGFPDHPHRGFETVTIMLEGRMRHRDSVGNVGLLAPGSVQWMTAGRGIVHSERASERDLPITSSLHGIQSWMALPLEFEEMEPSFIHYPADDLPMLEHSGCTMRVIMGGAFGAESPVATYSPTLYFEARMPHGTSFVLPAGAKERAAYVVSGVVRIDGREHRDGVLAVAREGATPSIAAIEDSRVMVIGGEPLGVRHIWWNYVSSSKERIERAKRDWVEGRIGKVPGDDEFIPLPDR